MINLESLLIWLGGVVFGVVISFFFKLVFADGKEGREVSTISSADADPDVEQAKRPSRQAPPFL